MASELKNKEITITRLRKRKAKQAQAVQNQDNGNAEIKAFLEEYDRKYIGKTLSLSSKAIKKQSEPQEVANPFVKNDEEPKRKRAKSAYALFCQANRLAFRISHPDLKPNELNALIAKKWLALSEAERKYYFNKALELKLKH